MIGVRSRLRDERGSMAGFILRIALAFVVLGTSIEEVGQIVVTQVRADSAARAGATAGADTYFSSRSQLKALGAAQTAVEMKDPRARIVGFTFSSQGAVTVTTVETAGTVLVKRIPFLRKAGVQHATETEGRTSI